MRASIVVAFLLGACVVQPGGPPFGGHGGHAAYPGMPASLSGVPVAPVPGSMRSGMHARVNPVMANPLPSEGEGEEQAAPVGGGSFTVALPNPAPLPNRVPTPEPAWQPSIMVPIQEPVTHENWPPFTVTVLPQPAPEVAPEQAPVAAQAPTPAPAPAPEPQSPPAPAPPAAPAPAAQPPP
jgi:hypothetical protein